MNRAIPPRIILPDQINIPTPQVYKFGNGNQLVAINAGTQDVAKVEIIVGAGTRYQEKMLAARSTAALLSEGTAKLTSQQIAENLDYLGSFSEAIATHDFASLTLFANNKQLDRSLDILSEMFYSPSFPENELEIHRKKSKQVFIVSEEKVATLARRAFYKKIFGNGHPYGQYAQVEDFDAITRSDLVRFHTDNYLGNSLFIVISGRISDNEVGLVEKYFGSSIKKPNPANCALPGIELGSAAQVFTEKSDSLQNAIRIGKATISRNHPDFPSLMVLNTVLGGYFGSRLMSNIREDKGYTYGINSMLVPFSQASVWVIGTQVGCEYSTDTVSEIYKEIERLKNEEIVADELDLVKSYLMGEVLRTFDGPFAISESFAGIYEYNNFDFSYFNRTIETINSVTSKQLLNIANKYLTYEGMVESVAGKIC